MQYGFITDESLQAQSTYLENIGSIDQGCGYLDDEMANYFIDRVAIKDTRAARLLALAQRAKGRVSIHLEKDEFTTPGMFDAVTELEWQQFQNVIELAYLSPTYTTAELDTSLLSDNSAYGVYVAGSLDISAVTESIPVTLEDSSTIATDIVTWVKFAAILDGVETSFHLWLSRTAFMADYPHSVVTAVVPPAKPEDLVNLGYSSIIDAIKETSDFMTPMLNANIGSNDHTGYLQFQTRFVNTNLSSHYYLSFGIFYKGAQPSSQVCRLAIRAYLEGIAGIDNSVWQSLFPDLYTVAQFYIIPMWDNTQIIGASTIFPGIIDGDRLPLAAKSVLSIPDVFIDEHYAIISTAVSELYLVVVPDSANDVDKRALLDIHSTYQAVGSENLNYAKQTTETQDFNEKLCGCLTNLLGATNNAIYIQNEIEGRFWLSFTSNHFEYHMLYRDDFPVL